MDRPIQSIRLGSWEVIGLVESEFALDGGIMFGVVPRIMWQKLLPPDEENRVPMEANVFLVRTGTANVLLDAGLGDALSAFDRKMYAPKGSSRLEESLGLIGLRAEDITHVIFSHLHTDHANGAFRGDPDRPTLQFPRAQFYVQSDEWEDATHPDERTRAVYVEPRLQLLGESGRLHLLSGDTEVFPGIAVAKTGGHSVGHQGIRVTAAGERFFYYGDVIPSRFHLKGPWVAAIDLFPRETMKAKRALLQECCDTPTVIGFDHDVTVMFGRIVRNEKWMDVIPVDTAPVPVASQSVPR
ncbi:MAG: MBL fold metallo-hydrolase [candidate division Zixibacteria bacterium]|nr:MBL fold metallo-hydrolase [candidate division Zixibacteria bacterium]